MTLPKKQQKNLVTKEYFQQSFRTGKTTQNQLKLSTESAKDDAETFKTPESEFVRPYDWTSYKEMEYFLLAPHGQADAREETPWDMPWTQPADTDAFQDYYGEVDIPDFPDLFFTSKSKLFIPLGSNGLRVSTITPITFIGFIDADGENFIPSGTDALNVRS